MLSLQRQTTSWVLLYKEYTAYEHLHSPGLHSQLLPWRNQCLLAYTMCNSLFAAIAVGVTAIAISVSKYDGGLRQLA